MKKITFLITALLVTFQLHTSAQFISGFGIKGGLTFSNQKYDNKYVPNFENNNVMGFNAGIYGEFLKGNIFNIYTETGYDQRGYAIPIVRTDEFGNPIGEDEFKYKTHYIFLTLGAKLKQPSKCFTPYILLQPRLNYYLDYSQKPPDGWPDIENPELKDFKKFIFDLGIGAGIELNRLLPYRISVEANYFPELITSYSGPYVNVKEHSFNFKLGVNFIKDKRKK